MSIMEIYKNDDKIKTETDDTTLMHEKQAPLQKAFSFICKEEKIEDTMKIQIDSTYNKHEELHREKIEREINEMPSHLHEHNTTTNNNHKEEEHCEGIKQNSENDIDISSEKNVEDEDKDQGMFVNTHSIHKFEFHKNKTEDEYIKESKEKHVKESEQREEKIKHTTYDDGNPEIQFFMNKNNLKIARYSWKVDNPKGYIFAVHGITSHLRNEYMCYRGRPAWVDDRKTEKKKEKESVDSEIKKGDTQISTHVSSHDSKDKTYATTENGDLSRESGEDTLTIGNTEISADSKKFIFNCSTSIETKERNVNEEIFKSYDSISNETDSCTRSKNNIQNEIAKNEQQEGTGSYNKYQEHPTHQWDKDSNNVEASMDITKPYKRNESLNVQAEKTDAEKNDVEKNDVENNDVAKNDVEKNDVEKNDVEKNDVEKNDAEKNETHGALKHFVSCSSCVLEEKCSSQCFDKENKHIISDSVHSEISSHVLIEDNNILKIDENEIKQIIHPTDVYFCSDCGLRKYCNCGKRILSYKNSWIEKLNKNDFSFFGIDNQSHGLSEGWENQRCNVQDFDNFVIDAVDALELFIKEWTEAKEMKPIIIMGLSMGGCIALQAVERIFRLNKEWKEHIKGLILVSPMISLEKQKSKFINKILIPVSRVLNYFYPHFTLSVKETNIFYPWIHEDSKNDPLQYFGPIKIKIGVECINASENCLTEEFVDQIDRSNVDILIIQSKYDSIVDPKGAIDFMNQILKLQEKRNIQMSNGTAENCTTGEVKTKNELEAKSEADCDEMYSANELGVETPCTVNTVRKDTVTQSQGVEEARDVENRGPIQIEKKRTEKREDEENEKEETEKEETEKEENEKRENEKEENEKEENEKEKTKKEENEKEESEIEENEKEENEYNIDKTPTLIYQYSNYPELLYSYGRPSVLNIKHVIQTRTNVWNRFRYGYYKTFYFKKYINEEKQDSNTQSSSDTFKNLMVYILKYGCHTLPSEPHTKEVSDLIINWLRSKNYNSI